MSRWESKGECAGKVGLGPLAVLGRREVRSGSPPRPGVRNSRMQKMRKGPPSKMLPPELTLPRIPFISVLPSLLGRESPGKAISASDQGGSRRTGLVSPALTPGLGAGPHALHPPLTPHRLSMSPFCKGHHLSRPEDKVELPFPGGPPPPQLWATEPHDEGAVSLFPSILVPSLRVSLADRTGVGHGWVF